MGRLIVIRHAQASLMKSDYDQLSELGNRQSEALGHFLYKYFPDINKVFRGSLKRHQQTTEIILSSFKNESSIYPEPEVIPEWNEHEGQKMGTYFIPKLMHVDPVMKKYAVQLGDDQKANSQLFLRIFHRLTELWAEGKVDAREAGAEDWDQFQSRIQEGIRKVSSGIQPDTTNLLITSGGSISVLMGEVLGLSAEQVLELSWIVRNSSISEFKLQEGRLALRSFNEIPHLEPELITFV